MTIEEETEKIKRLYPNATFIPSAPPNIYQKPTPLGERSDTQIEVITSDSIKLMKSRRY
jgi:hypothetical protein